MPMQLRCGDRLLDLSLPAVMGVLNVTPDSFSDGDPHLTPAAALARAEAMIAAGAALIDVGGESTRPGAEPVPVQQELDRVMPVIERLVDGPAIVSVDTRRPAVMRAALAAGARLVNDVNGLREPGALEAVAASGAGVCVMHMLGEPRTMQAEPVYGDVVADVTAFLSARLRACEAAGIDPARVCLDPGFGFGKTLAHNCELLRRLDAIRALGRPVLVGLSRKSMVGALTGRPVGERLYGSIGLAVLAVAHGARIVRTHDVAATVDAIVAAGKVLEGE